MEDTAARETDLGNFVSPVKVSQLDLAGVCAKDVLWFDVTVSNPTPVEKDQSVQQAREDALPYKFLGELVIISQRQLPEEIALQIHIRSIVVRPRDRQPRDVM